MRTGPAATPTAAWVEDVDEVDPKIWPTCSATHRCPPASSMYAVPSLHHALFAHVSSRLCLSAERAAASGAKWTRSCVCCPDRRLRSSRCRTVQTPRPPQPPQRTVTRSGVACCDCGRITYAELAALRFAAKVEGALVLLCCAVAGVSDAAVYSVHRAREPACDCEHTKIFGDSLIDSLLDRIGGALHPALRHTRR